MTTRTTSNGHHKTNGHARPEVALIPAVTYIRMSTDDQADSPDQQRTEVAKLAAREGCTILREYIDEGISGWKSRERTGFLRLIDDAKRKGDFRVILVWDQDRFSRFDPLEANHYWFLLREAGVNIISCAQGRLDFDDLGEWLKHSVTQHGKNQYSRDLSRNVSRGMLAKARQGHRYARAPYAYDRVFFNEKGERVYRIRFGQTFTTPETWTSTIEPSEDEAAVKTVRWLYHQLDTTDRSLLSLCTEMNQRGDRTPGGHFWRVTLVKQLLTNPTYAGVYEYGRMPQGRFSRVNSEGEIVAATPGKPKRCEAAVRIEKHHPAIVPMALFDRVQARLLERRMSGRKPRGKGFRLSSVLYCGHCGAPMYGKTGGKVPAHYACSNVPKGMCVYRTIRADFVETMLTETIRDTYLTKEWTDQLRVRIAQRAKLRTEASPADGAALEAQLAKLAKQIEKGTRNLMLADPDDFEQAQKVLTEWREERDSLQAVLDAGTGRKNRSGGNFEQIVNGALKELRTLTDHLADEDSAIARNAFRAVFSRVTVLWHPREEGERYYHVAKVVMSLRSDCIVNHLAGRCGNRPTAAEARRPALRNATCSPG